MKKYYFEIKVEIHLTNSKVDMFKYENLQSECRYIVFYKKQYTIC